MVASILDNPEKMVEMLHDQGGLDYADIERKIEEKQKEYGGLLTRAGAAYSLAKDMGLMAPKPVASSISGVSSSETGVSMDADVVSTAPMRAFERNGRTGKVRNAVIKDGTGQIKLVIWGDRAALPLKPGDRIRIVNAYSKNDELHLGEKGSLEMLGSTAVVPSFTPLQQLKPGDANVTIHASVKEAFAPKIIDVCAECGGMMRSGACERCKKTEVKRYPILNVELDDGASAMRATFYRERAEAFMGIKADDLAKDPKAFEEARLRMLGKTFAFIGNIKENTYTGALDFIVISFDGS
jgi:ssDNA-binding replication factor A large subunit